MNCDLCIHKDVCHAVAECLTSIPGFDCHSFEPERPRGEWEEPPRIRKIEKYNDGYIIYYETGWKTFVRKDCVICLENKPARIICPNCGADMKNRKG